MDRDVNSDITGSDDRGTHHLEFTEQQTVRWPSVSVQDNNLMHPMVGFPGGLTGSVLPEGPLRAVQARHDGILCHDSTGRAFLIPHSRAHVSRQTRPGVVEANSPQLNVYANSPQLGNSGFSPSSFRPDGVYVPPYRRHQQQAARYTESTPRGVVRNASEIEDLSDIPQSAVIAHGGLPGVAGHYARAGPASNFTASRNVSRPSLHGLGSIIRGKSHNSSYNLVHGSSLQLGTTPSRRTESYQIHH